MKKFFQRLIAVNAIAHIVFVVAAGHAMGGGLPGYAVALVVSAVLVALLHWRIALLWNDRPVSAARRLAERAYYAHWGACLLASILFLPGIVLAIAGVVSIGTAALAAYGVAFAIGTYAVFVRTRVPRIRNIDLPVKNLPPAFDGYRIAQLSDIHVGSLFPYGAVKPFIDAANRLRPDMIALTGDYLTSGTKFHEEAARLLNALQAKDGTFLIWGNHDNYGGREPLKSLLVAGGVRVLENESTRVARGDAALTIVGVDDIMSRRSDVAKSFSAVKESETVIALVHDPKQFPSVADHKPVLVLTGHTHWGQVGLPFMHERANLARRFFRYAGGLYEENGTTLYVHPGIGATGPPLRFGVAPEIAVFVLRRA